ncbi:hypothetical protein FNJ88_10440 [Chryseobacterium sp. SNU WT5]|uniref:hypothetical protein n=1 Tax=Chryseobacterium sp. SNU WT5 TaxID=2594269 RepID=UPI001180484F|nr:hypothetical protein [Chryseobacterium sp. SNU WT5]QDP85942.1 hypothetical protein FNJ88_10440 [Chryseobacterium sp. SNU WT5]
MQKSTLVKSDVRNHVKGIISQKIEKLGRFMEFTLDASREVKKTPKYDSIREEMQSEIYHMQKQMAALKNLQNNLAKVLNNNSERIQLGSIVFTNKARFYISVSLGEFIFEGDRFYAISEESPMAKIMFGKKQGDEFVLNNISQVIEHIW